MHRPRTITRLTLLGLAITLTPLVGAVVTAVIRVDALAESYRAAVLEAQIATQQGRSLVEDLTEMQRAVGQYDVVGNEDFRRTYLRRREAFRNAGENLTELELGATTAAELEALLRDERTLYARVGGDALTRAGEATPGDWMELTRRARAVQAVSSNLITDQANFGVETADELQRTLLLQAAAVLPATLVLAGVFFVSVTRPMRALGRAIRALGARNLATPIAIRGPRDIEELGAELDWLRRRIDELEQQKITFLRHISHELKTPLTTLREGSELLAESLAHTAPEEAEVSRLMLENSVRLQKLIEDLLQFGKTQEPITRLTRVSGVRLDELVAGVAATQSVTSTAKAVEVETELAEVTASVDPAKIRIVVDNLLTNAIKYTPAGGRIRIRLESSEGLAVIDVQDSGPGVDREEAAVIFEPFVQGRAVYESSVKGTGLGLAISKEYVESHGGKIEAVPAAAGAHFRVTLPLGETHGGSAHV